MVRVLKLAAAGTLLLSVSACGAPSIEEMGRSAIREHAVEGKGWFTKFTAATDAADRGLVASRLEGPIFGHYAHGWDSDGDFYTEHYYRKHLTTSGGWWGKQRTVSACVRYETETGTITATSINCPAGPPFSDFTDEWVTVP
jgi:hypothetical protein